MTLRVSNSYQYLGYTRKMTTLTTLTVVQGMVKGLEIIRKALHFRKAPEYNEHPPVKGGMHSREEPHA